jgi:hypothetical protein
MVDDGYEAAIDLLHRSIVPAGYVASPALPHYAAIWTRDGSITCLGANVTGLEPLLTASRATVETIASHRTELGMVANAYWPTDGYWDWGESGCTDDQAWFIIAADSYFRATRDVHFVSQLWPALEQSVQWLQHQDSTNFGLIDSPEAGDWMDSSLNRSGKVLHNNVLYLRAARAMHSMARSIGQTTTAPDPEDIRWRINLLFWPESDTDYVELLRRQVTYDKRPIDFPHPASVTGFRDAAHNRRFYLSHVSFGTFADTCDVLANLLAILCDVPTPDRANVILDHLARERAADPYPARTWLKPAAEGDNPWGLLKLAAERTQDPRWRNPPYSYHNGGVWPFIGGYYVMALAKAGRRDEAMAVMDRLAEANARSENQRWGFHEWLHGISGEPRGAPDQAWSAATFVMAYHALQGAVEF